MVTPLQRIAEARRKAKETWLSPEVFECPGCGMKFRYKTNLNEHKRKCVDYKYGKQED